VSYARAKSPPSWTLDLDDSRAKVGEVTRRKRRGDRLLDGDDGQSFEREDARHGTVDYTVRMFSVW
jgi:hypothetical protein